MRKGWFKIPGVQDGDRTLEEQLKGLGPLMDEVSGKGVFEFGCAEGLLLAESMRRGAVVANGCDVVSEAVAEAQRQLQKWPRCYVFRCDLNHGLGLPLLGYEAILFLAILHKLREPLELMREVFKTTLAKLIVLRTPAKTPGFVQDERSGNVVFDIAGELQARGFKLERVERGHLDEWTGYYRRAA